LLEELSTTSLDALDRARTMVILTVSPLEEHGPHLPLGVDAFTARHFATEIAGRLVATRTGWHVVLAPTLHLGSFTFDGPGTVTVRQRVVRDAVVDYGLSLARAGFRFMLVANGHAGPTHLAALEEAISPEDAWLAVSVDDRWQLEQWGSDVDAELALDNHHADFLAGASLDHDPHTLLVSVSRLVQLLPEPQKLEFLHHLAPWRKEIAGFEKESRDFRLYA